MQLPNGKQAVVPERKIRQYLLSLTHRDGHSKAVFFMRFGFTPDKWEILADALRHHANEHEVVEIEDTPFGTSYAIEGQMLTPDSRLPRIRTIWFIETGDSIPRFVTAFPLKGIRDD